MRRADRLFRIVTLLQNQREPLTARAIAEDLEVSVRTIYRDVADLIGSGVPVRGEAGIGYQLDRDYTLPPLMLTGEEVEAVVFGLAVTEEWGDPSIAGAARSLREKINAGLPADLRDVLAETRILAPYDTRRPRTDLNHPLFRRAIRERQVLEIRYEDGNGQTSHRMVWPLGLIFFGAVWMLGAWCETREAYRMFRLDRIVSSAPGARRFPKRKNRSLDDFMKKSWLAPPDHIGPHKST